MKLYLFLIISNNKLIFTYIFHIARKRRRPLIFFSRSSICAFLKHMMQKLSQEVLFEENMSQVTREIVNVSVVSRAPRRGSLPGDRKEGGERSQPSSGAQRPTSTVIKRPLIRAAAKRAIKRMVAPTSLSFSCFFT